MENKPYKLNKWVLFTLSIVSFGLGVLFSILSAYKSNKTFTIVGVIFFLLFTLLMQSFMFRMFKYKPKKEKYLEKYYYHVAELDLVSRLKKANFIFKKNKFGYVAVKVDNKTCYKVTIVDSPQIYLSDDENKVEDTPTKGIEYCTELVGFEFYTKDELDLYKKACMLSFANEKVLYESFLYDKENNRLIEANAIDPLNHVESYKKLQEILGLEYIGQDIVLK
jgi:hypothetical protein